MGGGGAWARRRRRRAQAMLLEGQVREVYLVVVAGEVGARSREATWEGQEDESGTNGTVTR